MMFLTHVQRHESHELDRLPVPLFPQHVTVSIKEVAADRPMSMAHSTLMLAAGEWRSVFNFPDALNLCCSATGVIENESVLIP